MNSRTYWANLRINFHVVSKKESNLRLVLLQLNTDCSDDKPLEVKHFQLYGEMTRLCAPFHDTSTI